MIAMPGMIVGGRIEAKITFGEILGHAVLWIIISVITLGVGLFFYPYSFSKFIINRTYIVTGQQQMKLNCDLDIGSQIGHIIIWLIVTVITLGIAYPFYLYKVWNFALNKTRIQA